MRTPERRRAHREANARRVAKARAARVIDADGRLVSPSAIHGTDSGYSNHQCRCRPCTDAHAAYMRRYVAGRQA